MTDREYLKSVATLAPDELEALEAWLGSHRCKKSERKPWVGRTTSDTLWSVRITETKMGSYARVKCELCGKEESITGKKRGNW